MAKIQTKLKGKLFQYGCLFIPLICLCIFSFAWRFIYTSLQLKIEECLVAVTTTYLKVEARYKLCHAISTSKNLVVLSHILPREPLLTREKACEIPLTPIFFAIFYTFLFSWYISSSMASEISDDLGTMKEYIFSLLHNHISDLECILLPIWDQVRGLSWVWADIGASVKNIYWIFIIVEEVAWAIGK